MSSMNQVLKADNGSAIWGAFARTSRSERRRRLSRRLLVMQPLSTCAAAALIIFSAALAPVQAAAASLATTTATQQQNLLSYYDQAATSTTFGEPVFRLEPAPSLIQLDQTRGATLMCLASGNPLPRISWFSSALGVDIGQNSALTSSIDSSLINLDDQVSRPVSNISGILQIVNAGAALRLLPFKEIDYRPEVHSAEYRCVAKNSAASVHSRSVQVQTVIGNNAAHGLRAAALRVNDELVWLGSHAVLRCRRTGSDLEQVSVSASPPSAAFTWTAQTVQAQAQAAQTTHRTPIEWYTSDGLQISATAAASTTTTTTATATPTQPTSAPNATLSKAAPKYIVFGHSGELHIINVDMADLRRAYACRTRTSQKWPQQSGQQNGAAVSSSNMAQLILATASASASASASSAGSASGQAAEHYSGEPQVLHTIGELVVGDSALASSSSPPPPPARANRGGAVGQGGGSPRPQAAADGPAAAVVMLPCAVRAAPQTHGRWLYRAPSVAWAAQAAQLQPLEQYAAANQIPVRVASGGQQQQQQQQRSGGQATTTTAMAVQKGVRPTTTTTTTTRTRLSVGPTHLAIEWPTLALSGRYVYQISSADGSGKSVVRTMCDINVIVRRPIKLEIVASLGTVAREVSSARPLAHKLQLPEPVSVSDSEGDGGGAVGQTAGGWQWISELLGASGAGQQRRRTATPAHGRRRFRRLARRRRPATPPAAARPSGKRGGPNPLLDDDPHRVRVRGAGVVGEPLIGRTGDRLQIECRASDGFPIESVHWFRDGIALGGARLTQADSMELKRAQVSQAAGGARQVSATVRLRHTGARTTQRAPPTSTTAGQSDGFGYGYGYELGDSGELADEESAPEAAADESANENELGGGGDGGGDSLAAADETNGGDTNDDDDDDGGDNDSDDDYDESGEARPPNKTAGRPAPRSAGWAGRMSQVVGRVVVRRLSESDVGLHVYECFASNRAGDRARASTVVFVASERQLDSARRCDEAGAAADEAASSNLTWPSFEAGGGGGGGGGGSSGGTAAGLEQSEDADAMFARADPLRSALILENEPVELQCPAAAAAAAAAVSEAAPAPGAANQSSPHQTRIDWLKTANRQAQGRTSAKVEPSDTALEDLNQLFSSDAGRLVINGSSLQMRAPSERHDAAVYVCRRTYGRTFGGTAASDSESPDSAGPNGPNGGADEGGAAAAAAPPPSELDALHQSSLLGRVGGNRAVALQAPTATCLAEWLRASHSVALGAAAAAALDAAQTTTQMRTRTRRPQTQTLRWTQTEHSPTAQLSSISIRIVAKPKIDPFEFSRSLEEGMRAVLVCAVVSGAAPVEITWFKDGAPLLAAAAAAANDAPNDDDDVAAAAAVQVEQSNAFSSTLTFHRIRAAHTGLYTCVASNAFASANHSSRLVVNVAPFFIETPKSQRALLGSDVLVNCRAGGQPSPQIRWRKLVTAAAAAAGNANPFSGGAAPPGGGGASHHEAMLEGALAPFAPSGAQLAQQPPPQSAAGRLEFRIITSNSHIQIIDNGSMIIKSVEHADATRYVCQASNGINPSLSELIELQVLSPARFDVNYETISVKRDSMIKFNCAPRGDQPMRVEWFKEGNLLAPAASAAAAAAAASVSRTSGGASAAGERRADDRKTKYSEVVYTWTRHNASAQQQQQQQPQQQRQHNYLMLVQLDQQQVRDTGGQSRDSVAQSSSSSSSQQQVAQAAAASSEQPSVGVHASELYINYADRSDSGTFTCVARNAYGSDELVYRLLVQEPPDAPYNIQAHAIQSNAARLTWTSPFDGNEPITHFVIEFRRVAAQSTSSATSAAASGSGSNSGPSEWARMLLGADKLVAGADEAAAADSSGAGVANSSTAGGRRLSVQLRQLVAKSQYQVRVAAINALGQGPYSPVHALATAEEAPNVRPNDLRAQPISSSSLKVLWRGPAPSATDERAPIRAYYVSHRRALSADAVSSSGGGGGGATGTGSGGWLATSSVSASNGTILAPSAQQQQQQQSAGQLLLLGANYELQLNNLDKNTRYEVRVQAYNSIGVGPASDTVGQTLKFDRPGQPSLRLVSARRQSFELRWAVAGDEPLMGFSLLYKCEYDEWQEIQLANIYHYVLENLRCGNKYQLYLSAFNAVGRSDPSDVLSARTQGTAPVAPDKGRFIRLNSSEVALDMTGWQTGGCPISSFMIQFKRLNDPNWFILSEGAVPFTGADRVTIPDLTPASAYKLLVTALNEAGSTNAEYVFSTLNSNGEPVPLPPAYASDAGVTNAQSPTQPQLPPPSERPQSGGVLSSISQLFSFADAPPDGARGAASGNQPVGSTQAPLHPAHGGGGGAAAAQQLLVPMSCLLLLLVTSLASYLYYSRASAPTTPAAAGRAHKRNPRNASAATNGAHQSAAAAAAAAVQHCYASADGGGANSTAALAATSTNGHRMHLSSQHSSSASSSNLMLLERANGLPVSNSAAFSNYQRTGGGRQLIATQTTGRAHYNGTLERADEPSYAVGFGDDASSGLLSARPFRTLQRPHRNASLSSPQQQQQQHQQQQQQQTNSSSLSTHSTQCGALDCSGMSQASSSGASSSQTAQNAKLELIDEAAAAAAAAAAELASHDALTCVAADTSKSHEWPPTRNHVELLVANQSSELLERLGQSHPLHAAYLAAAAAAAAAQQQQQQQQQVCRPAPTSMAASSSFVSASELMQQAALAGRLAGGVDEPATGGQLEPLYQQLDRFKAGCNLGACKQFNTLAAPNRRQSRPAAAPPPQHFVGLWADASAGEQHAPFLGSGGEPPEQQQQQQQQVQQRYLATSEDPMCQYAVEAPQSPQPPPPLEHGHGDDDDEVAAAFNAAAVFNGCD